MAWRDRLRRRAAGPSAGGPGRGAPDHSGGGAAGPSGAGSDRSASGAPGPSVPGDWDGGWRRTSPPELTVSRAPLGVSDGLAFRSGLAAWQNPSFDAGLGHALLPTAPTGLVRGVTGPAAPKPASTGGGPLLLRALRREGAADGTQDAGGSPDGAARAPAPPSRPSRSGSGVRSSDANSTAGSGSSGDVSRSRGITSAASPAVLSASAPAVQRAAEPDTGPVVTPTDTGRRSAAAEIPLVRRVSVVPGAVADGGVARPASQTPSGASTPNSGRASGSPAGSGGRTPSASGPVVQRSTTGTGTGAGVTGAQSGREGRQPEASRVSGAEVSHPVVRLRPTGPSLTAARHSAGPARRVPAVRPAATPAPDDGALAPTPGPASTAPPPVQRAPTRAALGAPLSELPSTAAPLPEGTPAPRPAPGPALPVVQRHTDGTADGTAVAPRPSDGGTKGTAHDSPADPPRRTSGARARGGLGAPLSALPASADLPGTTASGARAPLPAPGPDVQRAPASRDRSSTTAPGREDRGSTTAPAPHTTDHDRRPAEAAPRTSADAPLLGAGDVVQRALADHSSTGGTTEPGPTAHGNGPATPLVTPSSSAAPPSPTAAPHGPAAPERAVGQAGQASPAGDARRAGTTSAGGGPGSGRPGPQGPAASAPASAPGPVVVARAVAQGTGGATRPPGAADPRPRPLTVMRSAAHSAPAAPRTLSLLAARPLSLNTRAPEGVAGPAASRSDARPVVAARWPGASAAPQGDSAPPTGAPARRAPGPSATAPATPQIQRAATSPATPQVQRAATTHAGPGHSDSGVRGASSADSVQRVPVVRPAPPHGETPRTAAPAVQARSLPVTAPQAPPLADRPAVLSAPAPVGSVPVVRPRTVTPGPVSGTGGGTGRAATPVQRREIRGTGGDAPSTDALAMDAPPTDVPANAVPPRGRPRSASVSSIPDKGASGNGASGNGASGNGASGKSAARRAETPQDPALDLDDLARRLIDPVSRLLRTELRRGRERMGRPYDGRR
ncbi:hypothetical protein AB0I77_31800 [Streptomyces sp. NPDC050619]|uniref:hypothetical protein n=1 Tax=Streptomyces sp. NPDC050619 TaxID=3157214 RepID=UPI003414DC51